MKRKGILLALTALFVSAIIPTGVCTAMAAEDTPLSSAPELVSVECNEYDNFIYGGECYPVGKLTGVYSDGSKEELSVGEIEYTNVGVNFLSKVFESSELEGKVKGTDITFSQTITVVPDDLKYFINMGAEADDAFHAAMKNNFQLDNDKPVQESSDGSWGWTDTYQTEKKQRLTGVFDTIAFPSERSGHTNFDVTMPIGNGTYDLYIGHISFWHPRGVEVTVNGTKYFEDFTLQIRQQRETTVIRDVEVTDGKVDVSMNGRSNKNEAIAAFFALTPSDPERPEAPATPTAPEELSVSDNSFEVSSLQAGNMLLVANAETGVVILNEKITADTMTVDIPQDIFNTVNVLNIVQMNSVGASQSAQSVKTDIYNVSFEYDEAWSVETLPVTAKLTCESTITKLEVINGKEIETFRESSSEGTNFSVPFTIERNGDYVIKIYSSAGTVITQNLKITNIEQETPIVECPIDYKNSTLEKIAFQIKANNISPLTKINLYKNNALVSEIPVSDSKFEVTQTGFYTVTVYTESGHKSAYSFNVTFPDGMGVTANVKFDLSENEKDLNVRFQALTGYELDKVTVNAVMENGNVERMIVNNGNMPVYENGNYFATVLTKDGSMEVMAFQIENVGREASAQGGLHWGYGVLIGVGSAAVVGAVLIVVLRKKIFN